MTFLSITPETFDTPSAARPVMLRHARAPILVQLSAVALFTAGITVPGAVAQAKWSKLNLVLGFVQQRCVAAFSA